MPDTKISALAELTQLPDPSDLFVVVDVSDTSMAATGTDKKVQSSYIGTPVGSVMDFAGSSAPTGWLLCDGSSLLRAGTYAALFAVIGVVYGSVDGTHFTLPDLRGRIVAGKDNMGGSAANRLQTAWGVDGVTLGANGGTQSHQLTIAQMPTHNHLYKYPFAGISGIDIGTTFNQETTPTNPTTDTGGDQAHPNVQPTIIMNKIIKY